MKNILLYSDMTLFALLTGVIIPLLVGLLSKLNASSGLKAIFNFGLSAASSLLITVNETTFELKPFLINWAFTWAISVATFYGLWKPTGVSNQVQEKTANFGVG